MAEYDELGAQLDELTKEYNALKAPGLFQEKKTPGAISTYKLQREALAQRIADMKRKYEASIGNPGAVTGRTSAGMNAPLVPALRFDTPQLLPSVSTGQDFEQSAAPISTGALATVGQPRVRPKKKGVFADYQPSFGGAQESDVAMPLAAEPDVAQAEPSAPVVPVAPAAPQKGLREQYMERLAAMAKQPESSKMTEQQKGMALLEASLAGMAAASKPGASLFGSIGQGGQVGMAAARETEKANREQAERRRAEDQANVRTEYALAGQDIDRADRKEDKAETRRIREEDLADRGADRKATDKRENRRIDLLQKQIDAGKVQVVKNDESGTLVILNTTTNEKKDTGIKFKREDSRPAAVQLLDALADNPKRKETYREIYGEKGGISDKDIITQAVELTKSQAMGSSEPMEVILQRNIDAVRRSVGKSSTGGNPQADAIRERFKRGEITKDQAVKELQKLGFK